MSPLGRFAVCADRDDVERFRAATGSTVGGGVPATFPMRWLAAPEVRAALLSMAQEKHLVPFHEGQSFEYSAPLTVGGCYEMDLSARREQAPDRLVVAGAVYGNDGALHLRLETILRLFSAAAEAA